MTQRNTFTYHPKIVASEENSEAAINQFNQIMKDAPKPDDYPGVNLVVNPTIEFVGKKINISDLLAQYGINQQFKADATTHSTLSNNEGNGLSLKI